MIFGLAQVKLPVTDLARSVAWYVDVLGLRLWTEFVEDGEVRGVGLLNQDGAFCVALRDRRHCTGQPDLRGFDVVAFVPGSRAVLDDLTARCDALDVSHSGVLELPDGSVLDIPDPDGTLLRFYHYTGPRDRFVGMEMAGGRPVRRYREPRLEVRSRPTSWRSTSAQSFHREASSP